MASVYDAIIIYFSAHPDASWRAIWIDVPNHCMSPGCLRTAFYRTAGWEFREGKQNNLPLGNAPTGYPTGFV